jgi:hypothetical protein
MSKLKTPCKNLDVCNYSSAKQAEILHYCTYKLNLQGALKIHYNCALQQASNCAPISFDYARCAGDANFS